jgi:hypothetical protein
MRALAELHCESCARDYYGDLPVGHGLGFPALLDVETGEVHHPNTLGVFADHLAESFKCRVSTPVGLEVEVRRSVRRGVILNCLDWVYGHALLKLLNAQYYLDREAERELIVIVPRALRWMVPDGVAEIWTVDLPFSRGSEWNDWLAQQIGERVEALEDCMLSFAVAHPRSEDFDIERFTGVSPFRLETWLESLVHPTVTYIWRDDRGWGPQPGSSYRARGWRAVRRLTGRDPAPSVTLEQVVELGERLRELIPAVDFAVAGLGSGGPLPGWIGDLRSARSDESTERSWCERYSRSQVVIGVHGSHMLLPSAHAGGLIEMVTHNRWDTRWGNIIQDVLVRGTDVREALFRYHFLPDDTSPRNVATIAAAILRFRPTVALHFGRTGTDHAVLRDSWQTARGAYSLARPAAADRIWREGTDRLNGAGE